MASLCEHDGNGVRSCLVNFIRSVIALRHSKTLRVSLGLFSYLECELRSLQQSSRPQGLEQSSTVCQIQTLGLNIEGFLDFLKRLMQFRILTLKLGNSIKERLLLNLCARRCVSDR